MDASAQFSEAKSVNGRVGQQFSSEIAGRSARFSPNTLGLVELLEGAWRLHRQTLLSHAWRYYLGALPFVLALLWTWSRLASLEASPDQIAGYSLLLAVLYGGKILAQAAWMRDVFDLYHLRAASAFNASARLLAAHALLLLIWLLSLPVLALAAPIYVAMHYLPCAAGAEAQPSLLGQIRQALRMALRWYRGQHILWFWTACLYLVVAFDLMIALLVMPGLLQGLLGVAQLWSRAGGYLLNTTLLALVFAGTYLLLDPVIKLALAASWRHFSDERDGAGLFARLETLRLASASASHGVERA